MKEDARKWLRPLPEARKLPTNERSRRFEARRNLLRRLRPLLNQLQREAEQLAFQSDHG